MLTPGKLFDLLAPSERRDVCLLLGMVLIMAFLDMLGVASIMPFIALLANPDLLETNVFLSNAYRVAPIFGIETQQSFLFALGIVVFALLVISLTFKALTTYALLRFSLMREYSISKRLMDKYMQQSYDWFLSRHSADLGKIILSDVQNIIGNGVIPIMTLVAQGAVAVAILILLILIDLKLALAVSLALVSAYFLIFKSTSGFLARIGKEGYEANTRRFKAISEAFGAIKEVKLSGTEQVYIQRFAKPAQTYARHQASMQVTSQIPRFVMEATAFGGMLVVVLYLMVQTGDLANALPVIALYAYAGYRLMPALQQIYGAITQLSFVGPAVNALNADLLTLQATNTRKRSSREDPPMVFAKAITLNQIDYCYPNAPHAALKGLSLVIPANSVVGIVGSTGSGKTTAVDLILGLLEAQAGTLQVDDKIIDEKNRKAWQRVIGYVPQQIYLIDDTIAKNIAFGIDTKDINPAALERAVKLANLHEFIDKLPNSYNTIIGERGVRLSGGQRQRIGIARALYHNPQVLIMDEATSALDKITEDTVMDAVHNRGLNMTVILVAHRLSTVRACDIIFLIENGTVRHQGTFEELLQTSKIFRAMVGTTPSPHSRISGV